MEAVEENQKWKVNGIYLKSRGHSNVWYSFWSGRHLYAKGNVFFVNVNGRRSAFDRNTPFRWSLIFQLGLLLPSGKAIYSPKQVYAI
ncbi:hypothetical protein OWV82_017556 [Melia azedarach]|uniref:Uncharacterized protein n=1 Tax=Melia azedarach TaxID=155640 RepID=A0ACC1XMM3_MELAZ|nr:hypothetical protein OWV82_017556 [Melia azedarach]